MRVHSLFRFPGGKQKFSKQIVGNLSKFLANHVYEYREPFIGSAGTCLQLLPLPHVKQIWINDKDFGVAAIWNAVLTDPDRLCALIDSFQPSTEAFYEFKEFLKSDNLASYNVVEVGFKKLAIHQISYSGLGTKAGGPLGGDSQESDYQIDCRWNPKNLVSKIKILHRLLRKKMIGICTNHDFQYVLNAKGNALFYLDPPYYVKGGELYEKSFSKEDHIRLSECLKQLKQPWVLSYDDCEAIRDLYQWAAIKTINANYTITTSRSRNELLISPEKYKFLIYVVTEDVIAF